MPFYYAKSFPLRELDATSTSHAQYMHDVAKSAIYAWDAKLNVFDDPQNNVYSNSSAPDAWVLVSRLFKCSWTSGFNCQPWKILKNIPNIKVQNAMQKLGPIKTVSAKTIDFQTSWHWLTKRLKFPLIWRISIWSTKIDASFLKESGWQCDYFIFNFWKTIVSNWN